MSYTDKPKYVITIYNDVMNLRFTRLSVAALFGFILSACDVSGISSMASFESDTSEMDSSGLLPSQEESSKALEESSFVLDTSVDYYLTGDFNDWNYPGDYKFTWAGDYCVLYSAPLLEGSQFKVWARKEGRTIWYPTGSFMNLTCPEDGTFEVYYYPAGAVEGLQGIWLGDVRLVKTGAYAEPEVSYPDYRPTEYWFCGSNFGGYGAFDARKPEAALIPTKNYHVVRDLDLPSYTRFQIYHGQGGSGSSYSADPSDHQLVVTSEGRYDCYYYPDGLPKEYEGQAYNEHIVLHRTGSYQGGSVIGRFLVGNFSDWAINERAYRFNDVMNYPYTNYALNDVHIEGSWEFKVCCTDGTWYPGGTGNNCTLPTGNYNLFLYPEYHAYGDALADCIQYIQLL